MKLASKIAGSIVVGTLAFITVPARANVIIGAPGDVVNSIPFGSTVWGTQYQQVYNSTNFSGPITIGAIIFYDTIDPGGQANGGTFTFSLSTTSAAVGGLNQTNLSSNIGGNNAVVYTGTLPALSGGEIEINLSTSFTYNPLQGNLLLNIGATDPTSGGAFFDSMTTNNSGPTGIFSRAWSFSSDFPTSDTDQGLVTDFVTSQTPLPASWTAMLAGLVLVGFFTMARKATGSHNPSALQLCD